MFEVSLLQRIENDAEQFLRNYFKIFHIERITKDEERKPF